MENYEIELRFEELREELKESNVHIVELKDKINKLEEELDFGLKAISYLSSMIKELKKVCNIIG